VCLGVPCILGQAGVIKVIEAPLSQDEQTALEKSAHILQEALKNL